MKQERREGATVRLNDMPGQLEGLTHIFDRLKSSMDDPTFKRWRREQFKKLAEACANNHGAVFDYYIERLIFHGREKVRKVALKWIETFVLHVGTGTDGDIARDVARNFGLIYAAGVLGIKLRILPWTAEELLDAISKCYFAARELLPDDGVALRRGIAALRVGLLKLPVKDRVTNHSSTDGFCEPGPNSTRYVIKCDSFNSLFDGVHDRDLTLDWLIRHRWITLAMPKDPSANSKAKPKNQHDWPDGRRRRSYEIRVPRKSRTAKACKNGETTG